MICIEDFIQALYKEAKKGNYDYIEVNEYIEINSHDKTIIQKKFNSMLLLAKLIKKKCLYKLNNKTNIAFILKWLFFSLVT
jgi:hypothetical protein